MANWAGKWKGGRFYLDGEGRRVFCIERRGRVVKLQTHDEELACGELARFLVDPIAFTKPAATPARTEPVFISKERVKLYLESIHDTVSDHRAARLSQLDAWAELALDLRVVEQRQLRVALGTFKGGHRGRAEALNAFARFLVKIGDLDTWRPLLNHRAPASTRAEREAYSLEQLAEGFARITNERVRDVFRLKAATGLHHTEIEQLEDAKIVDGPLPEKGPAIRRLNVKHKIAGVLQVVHKTKPRHRQSVDAPALAAALRLRDSGVPDRVTMWEALAPLVPSNLRHTFVTLAGEVGEVFTYTGAGVDRSRIAAAIGHRAGSTMTADRYDKTQVPPLVWIPLPF